MPQTVRLSDTIARLRLCFPVVALSLLMSVAGCNKPPEIRSYKVAKTDREVPKRTVAATLLADNRAWFFKTEGPPEVLESKVEELTSFFETITGPESTGANPTWKLPEGWDEVPAGGMRLATLKLPSEAAPLEMAVTTLARTAEEQEYLLINVNRWRGQLGLEPVEQTALDKELTELEIEGGKLWVFDATGTGSPGPSMPPMMAGHPPAAAQAPPAAANQPPAEESEAPPTAEQITYELPEGWSEAGSRPMVLKVIKITSEAGEADLAISVYPVHGSMADPLSNVNRWRGQVGLPPITTEELPESTEEVTVSEDKATLVTLLNPDTGEDDQAMVAALVPRDKWVWFLKMSGPRKVVEQQREQFGEWLKTVRMAEGNS
jgi:hypothetical protein